LKFRKPILLLTVAAVLLAALLTGYFTGAWRFFADAAREVRSFFSDGGTDYLGDRANPLHTDAEPTPELIASTHTELLPSPYNALEWESTVASVGTTDLSYPSDGTLTEDEKLGYTFVPAFTDRQLSSVGSVLKAHGITYRVVERTNTAPAGEVIAVTYAGFSEDAGYAVNPSVGVILTVSAEKRAKTAEEGTLVYLTFDDGPSTTHTLPLLEILDEYGVKATFFTLGSAVVEHPELANAIVDRGHTVACHTMTHVYSEIYASVASLDAEVTAWEEAVSSVGITLGENKLFRFPGGSVGNYFDSVKRNAFIGMLESRGYRIYDWNASANDAVLYLAPHDETNYDYIKESFADSFALAEKTAAGKENEPIIILMHESAKETPELIRWILEYIIDRGYSFGDLAERETPWMFAG